MLVTAREMNGGRRRRRVPNMGQSQQDSWWRWFFTGQGAPPPKPYKEAGILSSKPTAAAQRTAFDSYTASQPAAWGDEAYEAAADEDIDVMAPQGSDAESLTGMGDTTASAPGDGNHTVMVLAGTVVLGSALAVAWHAIRGRQQPKVALNNRRRN
jgi:hypothetical protein